MIAGAVICTTVGEPPRAVAASVMPPSPSARPPASAQRPMRARRVSSVTRGPGGRGSLRARRSPLPRSTGASVDARTGGSVAARGGPTPFVCSRVRTGSGGASPSARSTSSRRSCSSVALANRALGAFASPVITSCASAGGIPSAGSSGGGSRVTCAARRAAACRSLNGG